MLKKAGITHIVTPAAYQGVGFFGEKLVNESSTSGTSGSSRILYAIYLFKLR